MNFGNKKKEKRTLNADGKNKRVKYSQSTQSNNSQLQKMVIIIFNPLFIDIQKTDQSLTVANPSSGNAIVPVKPEGPKIMNSNSYAIRAPKVPREAWSRIWIKDIEEDPKKSL